MQEFTRHFIIGSPEGRRQFFMLLVDWGGGGQLVCTAPAVLFTCELWTSNYVVRCTLGTQLMCKHDTVLPAHQVLL